MPSWPPQLAQEHGLAVTSQAATHDQRPTEVRAITFGRIAVRVDACTYRQVICGK